MTLGTGIFLSSIFLGLCYLFIQTKNRWNWKKICFWSLGLPLLLTILMIGYFSVNSLIENLPKIITEIKGIHLGDSKSDLIFKHELSEEPSNETLFFTNNVQAIFDKENKVNGLIYVCTNNDYWSDSTKVNGISCYDSGDKIIDHFGKEKVNILCQSEQKVETDKPSTAHIQKRFYTTPQYNVEYILNKNIVEAFFIKKPKTFNKRILTHCE